jgi:uncharacterized integral membrane protein
MWLYIWQKQSSGFSGGIMWAIRSFLILVLVAAALLFASYNRDYSTPLSLGFRDFNSVPIALLMIEAFILGMFVWFLISIFREASLRSDLRAQRRKMKRLTDELVALRNAPVEEARRVVEDESS